MTDISFCSQCGDYIAPGEVQVRMDDNSIPMITCPACSKIGVLQPAEAGIRSGQCDENILKNVVDVTGGPGDNE